MNSGRSKRLFVLWLIAFLLFCVAVSFFASKYSYEHQLIEKDLPGSVKFLLSCILLLGYCPTLLVIHNFAKKEQALKIKRRSLFFFVTIAIAALGTIVAVIFA